MQQIDFITVLKQLNASQQGYIKKNVNDEIKQKAVQDAVRKVYDELMNSVQGSSNYQRIQS